MICLNCETPGCDSIRCLPVKNKHLFVYGTLKKGHGNHRLLERATFIGPAVSHALNFVMDGLHVDDGEGDRGKRAAVKGELYEVPTDKEWTRLDRLESHPDAWRREVRPFVTEQGKKIDAWIYLYRPTWMTTDFVANPRCLNSDGQYEWVWG